MKLTGQIRREAFPLAFFGTVVAVKAYYLARHLVDEGGWDNLQRLLHRLSAGDPVVTVFLIDTLAYLCYSLAAIAFDALVFASYLMRMPARRRAQGFWERVFPLATVLIPVIGFTLLSIPAVRAQLPGFDLPAIAWRLGLDPAWLVLAHTTAFAVAALGASLSVAALWSLRRSFSLMTEVRALVTGGLYRRIRHPLYMAEILHVFGLAVLAATPVALWLFVAAVAMQVLRAKIEERKLLGAIPEYATFRARTGFLWPRLRSNAQDLEVLAAPPDRTAPIHPPDQQTRPDGRS